MEEIGGAVQGHSVLWSIVKRHRLLNKGLKNGPYPWAGEDWSPEYLVLPHLLLIFSFFYLSFPLLIFFFFIFFSFFPLTSLFSLPVFNFLPLFPRLFPLIPLRGAVMGGQERHSALNLLAGIGWCLVASQQICIYKTNVNECPVCLH